MNEEEIKQAMKEAHKEAMKEWLDQQFATFGKWALMSFLALVFAALIYLILIANGWQKAGLP